MKTVLILTFDTGPYYEKNIGSIYICKNNISLVKKLGVLLNQEGFNKEDIFAIKNYTLYRDEKEYLNTSIILGRGYEGIYKGIYFVITEEELF